MNENGQGIQPQPTESEEVSTPSAAAAQPAKEGWQMPEPTFQQTSGYLPQGYLDLITAGGTIDPGKAPAQQAAAAEPVPVEAAPLEIAEEVASPSPSPVSLEISGVEPQPDLTEQLDAKANAAAAPKLPVKERSPALRMTLIILGLIGMIAFIFAFLALIYFLFIAPPGTNSPF